MGIHPGRSERSGNMSGRRQMGGPQRGRFSNRGIGKIGATLGRKEKQSKNDLRKIEPRDAVKIFFLEFLLAQIVHKLFKPGFDFGFGVRVMVRIGPRPKAYDPIRSLTFQIKFWLGLGMG